MRVTSNVAGNLVPSLNEVYDLGSATHRWRDLYLSGTTINLGGVSMSSDGTAISLPAGSTIGGVSAGTLILKGSVSTNTNLPLSPTPNIGDSYVVLDGIPTPHLYAYTGEGLYVDMGTFQGPTGTQGATGTQGPFGVQGSTGSGAQGVQGTQGFTGTTGYALLDLSAQTTLNVGSGATVTTVNSVSGLSTTAVVPSSASIIKFDGISNRTVTTKNKVFLVFVDYAYYYVNAGLDGNWGETPDVNEDLFLHSLTHFSQLYLLFYTLIIILNFNSSLLL